jgi:hypothetical protein
MKQYQSDDNFNIYILDENKIKLVVMPCGNKEACDYYKNELNRIERNEQERDNHTVY